MARDHDGPSQPVTRLTERNTPTSATKKSDKNAGAAKANMIELRSARRMPWIDVVRAKITASPTAEPPTATQAYCPSPMLTSMRGSPTTKAVKLALANPDRGGLLVCKATLASCCQAPRATAVPQPRAKRWASNTTP